MLLLGSGGDQTNKWEWIRNNATRNGFLNRNYTDELKIINNITEFT